MSLWLACCLALLNLALSNGCVPRDYGNGATVCVCTSDECDTIEPIRRLPRGQYALYTSSKNGARFNMTTGHFITASYPTNNNTLRIRRDKTYQSIFGFGGAFTDSTGINILSLSNATRNVLMRAYFSNEGLQYSMGRIPMGGTDFSTHPYTYDDVDHDYELQFFSLQTEDYQYKIPLIHEAQRLTNNDLKFFGSAWSAPAWMKTNNHYTGIGFLNITMYDAWAQYYLKFIQAYSNQGIDIWGVTTGNEPANGFHQMIQINDMGWVPKLQAQWITENLGPRIRLSDYPDVKIMIVDDQRVYFPWIVRYILDNDLTTSYVDGSAVHYYTDRYVPADVLSITHYDYPNKFIFASEGCEGSLEQRPVILGSWDRAEGYLSSIIDDMNNWVTGWMDWNMALNLDGGPTFANNFVDSPIIINKTADEFYKQPMFYAMGHFSKFVRPGSVRVSSKNTVPDLSSVVFRRPDNGTVISIFNPTDNDIPLVIVDDELEQQLEMMIERRSINTLIHW